MSRNLPIFCHSRVFDFGLSATELAVLCCLVSHADKNGRCFPGAARIAERSRVHPDTVWAALRRLEAVGALTRHAAKGRSNQYQLHSIDRWVAPIPPARKRGVGAHAPETKGLVESEGRVGRETEGLPPPGKKGREVAPLNVNPIKRAPSSCSEAAPDVQFGSDRAVRIAHALGLACGVEDPTDCPAGAIRVDDKTVGVAKNIIALFPTVQPGDIMSRAASLRAGIKRRGGSKPITEVSILQSFAKDYQKNPDAA